MKKKPKQKTAKKRLVPKSLPARETAEALLTALARASGEPPPALDNFVENDPRDEGDVFYVVGPIVTSSTAKLEKDFTQAWNGICEYAWVETKWWCDDRKKRVAAAWKRVRPDFFHIGEDGVLRPVRDQNAWATVIRKRHRAARQLAFLDRALADDVLLASLTARIELVCEAKLPHELRFVSDHPARKTPRA